MNISNVIKSARRERGFTQEMLAERLGVSVSAVSQWESGRTAPDLSLIAPLCNLLEISADRLFGIDLANREEKIKQLDEQAHKFSSRGYGDEAERLLREGLREFPGDFTLTASLMFVIHDRAYRAESAERKREILDEVIRMGENLLAECTDSDRRASAIQLLIYSYDELGESEKAEKLADAQPTLVLSREFLMSHITKGQRKIECEQALIGSLIGHLADRIMWAPYLKNEDGSELYSREERFGLREKQIALYKLMYEDGSCGFGHTRLSNTEYKQAVYFAENGDTESALERLERAAGHAIGFLDYYERGKEFKYTSLLLRGHAAGSFSTNSSDNEASALLSWMKHKALDCIRDSDRFKLIEARLTERAGKWQVR